MSVDSIGDPAHSTAAISETHVLYTPAPDFFGPSVEDYFPVEENLTHGQVTNADYIWTGAADTTWDTGGNWNPDTGTPAETDVVVIPGGLAIYPVLKPVRP